MVDGSRKVGSGIWTVSSCGVFLSSNSIYSNYFGELEKGCNGAISNAGKQDQGMSHDLDEELAFAF